MEENDKYAQPKLSVKEVTEKLNNASPLQASRVLIDMELFDQKSSTEVLESIYEEFDSGESVIDELIKPIGLSVLDSLITHKDLKLDRTGLTASRVWEEVNGFDYSTSGINAKTLSSKQQLERMRDVEPGKRKNVDNPALTKHKENNTNPDGTITNELDGSKLHRHGKGSSTLDTVNTEHLYASEKFNQKYGNNVFVTDETAKGVVNSGPNLASISERQNKMKQDGTFQDIKDKKLELEQKKQTGRLSAKEQEKLDKINESFPGESLDEGIRRENKAKEEIEQAVREAAVENVKNNTGKVIGKAAKQAGEQTAYQAIGHAVILIIKPVFFEFKDAFKNGLDKGVNKKSSLEGLKARLERVFEYISKEVVPTLEQGAKDFFENFLKVILDSILGLAKGIFKSVLKIIVEGFSALIGAFKILGKSAEEMSSAQKSDAILKLLASTVTTFIVFYFESTIVQALPLQFLKDIALAMLSGIASTFVVYLLDKLDLFSAKAEVRNNRINEIFDMRIQQIKENTDAFEAASIEKLAKDRLQFQAFSEQLNNDILSGKDPNSSVTNIADFMKVDLKIKSTEDFMQLLANNKTLEIA